MASFIQLSPILYRPQSHSSSYWFSHAHNVHLVSRVSFPPNTRPKRNLLRKWVISEASGPHPPPPPPRNTELVKRNFRDLINQLNRGLGASENVLQSADAAAKVMEVVGGPVDLSLNLDNMKGSWKLIYSSALSEGYCAGSTMLEATVGEISEIIDIENKGLDNIVEFQYPGPPPLMEPIEVNAKFAHTFELIGPSKVKLKFDSFKSVGNTTQPPPLETLDADELKSALPPLEILEELRPPWKTGTSEFEVTYLDEDIRITRTDEGKKLWIWSRNKP